MDKAGTQTRYFGIAKRDTIFQTDKSGVAALRSLPIGPIPFCFLLTYSVLLHKSVSQMQEIKKKKVAVLIYYETRNSCEKNEELLLY